MRFTVEDAAAAIGMTTGAVRNRLSQGTLRSIEEHGTVYVLLPADTSRDTARGTGDTPGESSALVSEMVNRIAFLERKLERIERERERKDAILRNIGEAIKAISSPTEQQPGLEGAEELTQELAQKPEQKPAQMRRSGWWSGIFRG